ncbi:hypothetical protein NCCNTM_17640 [Mycolicibacterium sp. NCC-Tsukiji]|nr:hypothetical protein NCCNTM_17640 [Mycolicibacterium sp. NCC-Tsukiji]
MAHLDRHQALTFQLEPFGGNLLVDNGARWDHAGKVDVPHLGAARHGLLVRGNAAVILVLAGPGLGSDDGEGECAFAVFIPATLAPVAPGWAGILLRWWVL